MVWVRKSPASEEFNLILSFVFCFLSFDFLLILTPPPFCPLQTIFYTLSEISPLQLPAKGEEEPSGEKLERLVFFITKIQVEERKNVVFLDFIYLIFGYYEAK